MSYRTMARLIFWLLAACVLFLALVPGPLGQMIRSDTGRHFLAFLVLPAIAFAAWPEAGPFKLWLGFALFGGAIEISQWAMHLGREAQWSDWRNDLIAAAISLTFSSLFAKAMDRREFEPPS